MYKITVERITEKKVEKSVYVGKDKEGANQYGYRNEVVDQQSTQEIYTQEVEDLSLVDVINAVNRKAREE